MITLKDVTFGYRRKTVLFDRLSAVLRPGSITGLLGKNGAGKTTLLKLLSGLRFPGTGTVNVSGFQPGRRQTAFLQSLFLIPEEFFLPGVSIRIYEDLYSPFYPRFNPEQFRKYCLSFELDRNQKISSLSMGQKKKLLFGFGLAANTKILLLDEPTNGLDIPSKSAFRKMTAAALSRERIIIIATHQVRDVENLIDSILILDNGRAIFHHSLETVSHHLLFTLEEPPGKDALYSEKIMQGHLVIKPNIKKEDSPVHLEPLFNAVIADPSRMDTLFKGADHEA
jgi:ABC-2 type transport system ATP-binding protein